MLFRYFLRRFWVFLRKITFFVLGNPTDTQRLLILVWMIALFAGEWLVFPVQLRRCADRILRSSPLQGRSHSTADPAVPAAFYRLAIIADPQLTDAYSYKQSPGLSLWFTQFYSDLYMRRAFATMQASFEPEAVLFLGDLMDGGREWVEQREDTFRPEWERFHRRVFRLRNPEHTKVYYMAGNHDIGFGDRVVIKARERYIQNFGSLNYVFQANGYDVVVLDTVSLSADNDASIQEESLDFLTNLEKSVKARPRILFTHVPLYRDGGAGCEAYSQRTAPLLHQAAGYQYQNLVTAEWSRRILDVVQPSVVFSGDDHDQCLYYHVSGDKRIPEFTIGTFSWLQGNRYPSFAQVLVGDSELAVDICFMPANLDIYLCYVGLFVLSVGVLIIKTFFFAQEDAFLARDYELERGYLMQKRDGVSRSMDYPMTGYGKALGYQVGLVALYALSVYSLLLVLY